MSNRKIKVSIQGDFPQKNQIASVLNHVKTIHLVDSNTPNEDASMIGIHHQNAYFPLIQTLAAEIEDLMHQKDAAEELQAIVQSAIEGIEATDMNGKIKYVNPAFLKITGIPAEERIGQNIFEKNPDGLLCQVLKHGKPLHHVTTRAPGSGVEVIASATPVYKDGVMTGAVIVVSDISNTIKIAKELEKSKSMLDSLYDKIGNHSYSFEQMVGVSHIFTKTVEHAKRYAQSHSTVLILGESGTGKELFAQAIYNHNDRSKGPFISINCAAIPSNLLESELFGHEKGAFTGADRRRIGMFELAQNGTIFLDEIGDLDYQLQGKLLRVLQENEFRRVGGNEIIRTNVRVIAATNRPLQKLMSEGKFREDVYYRLNVLQLRIPPLRERKEDIPALVDFFINKYNRKLGKSVMGLQDGAMEILLAYDWPGNIRELENVVERAVNMVDGKWVTSESLSLLTAYEPTSVLEEQKIIRLAEMERKLIEQALHQFGTSVEGKKLAAKALGISLASLYNKIRGIKPKSEQDFNF